MRILTALFLLTLASFAQVPAVPDPTTGVPLQGRIAPQGNFPLLNGGSVTMPADADFTLVYPQFTGSVLRIESAVNLTQTRSIIHNLPSNQAQRFGFEFGIQNATSGGQDIVFKANTGNGVTIPNGQAMIVMFDGTNYVKISGGDGVSGGGVNPQFVQSLTAPPCTAKCDGVTDDTLAIRACIAHAQNNPTLGTSPTPIYVPPAPWIFSGCVITDTIVFGKDGQTLFGDNPLTSGFLWKGNDPTKAAVEFTSANGVVRDLSVTADATGCGTPSEWLTVPCGTNGQGTAHAWRTGISFGGGPIPDIWPYGGRATQTSFRNVAVSCGGYLGSQRGDGIQMAGATLPGQYGGQADQVTFDRAWVAFCRYGTGFSAFSPNAVSLFINGSSIFMNHIAIATGLTSDWHVKNGEIDNNDLMVYGVGGGASTFESIRAETTKRYFYTPGGIWTRPISWSGNWFTNWQDLRDTVTATVTQSSGPYVYVTVPPPTRVAVTSIPHNFIEGDNVVLFDSATNRGIGYQVVGWQNPDGTPSYGNSLRLCCSAAPSVTNPTMTSYLGGCSIATHAGSTAVELIGGQCLKSDEYYNVASAGPLPTVILSSAAGTGGVVSVTTMDGGVKDCTITSPGSGYTGHIDAAVSSGDLGKGAVLRVWSDGNQLAGCWVLSAGNSYGDWPAGAFTYDSATTGHFQYPATRSLGVTINDGIMRSMTAYLMASPSEMTQFQNWIGLPVVVHGAGFPEGNDLITTIQAYIPQQPPDNPSTDVCRLPSGAQQFPCILLASQNWTHSDRNGITVNLGYTKAYYWLNHWGQFAFIGGTGPHTFTANTLGNANYGHFAAQCAGDNGCAFIGNLFSDLAPNPGWITNIQVTGNQFTATKNWVGGSAAMSMPELMPYSKTSMIPETSGYIVLDGAAAKRFTMNCTSYCYLGGLVNTAPNDTIDVLIKGTNTYIGNSCAPGTICTGIGSEYHVTQPGIYTFRMGDDSVARMLNAPAVPPTTGGGDGGPGPGTGEGATNFNQLQGNIAVSQMNGGNGASADTFWRGDGIWDYVYVNKLGGANGPIPNQYMNNNGWPLIWQFSTDNNTGMYLIDGEGAGQNGILLRVASQSPTTYPISVITHEHKGFYLSSSGSFNLTPGTTFGRDGTGTILNAANDLSAIHDINANGAISALSLSTTADISGRKGIFTQEVTAALFEGRVRLPSDLHNAPFLGTNELGELVSKSAPSGGDGQGPGATHFNQLEGNIAISQMNGGNAANTDTFWRGDGYWGYVTVNRIGGADAAFTPWYMQNYGWPIVWTFNTNGGSGLYLSDSASGTGQNNTLLKIEPGSTTTYPIYVINGAKHGFFVSPAGGLSLTAGTEISRDGFGTLFNAEGDLSSRNFRFWGQINASGEGSKVVSHVQLPGMSNAAVLGTDPDGNIIDASTPETRAAATKANPVHHPGNSIACWKNDGTLGSCQTAMTGTPPHCTCQ